MAPIPTKTFQTILEDAVAAVQGAARQLLDFTVGSVLRAVLEATGALALWLQGVALQIASLTRFSTSNGADADSWAADFDFPRLPAQAATGPVTLARFTPTNQALVPVGTFVQTADGSQRFEIIPDTNQAAYDATQAAYVIPAAITSISVTVQAAVPGSAGNVGARFVTQLGSSINGVDTVTNPGAFETGADAETDPAFRARFVLYIAGLSKATPAAIGSAIENIQQGVVFEIVENQAFDGTPKPGYFYVVVDDGSGNPSGDFLASVSNAVESVRAVAATYGVFGPVAIGATVTMTLAVAAGFDAAAVRASVTSALQVYLSSLGMGQILPYTRLSQVAWDATPGITNVTQVLLNGDVLDLATTAKQVVRASSIVVS